MGRWKYVANHNNNNNNDDDDNVNYNNNNDDENGSHGNNSKNWKFILRYDVEQVIDKNSNP